MRTPSWATYVFPRNRNRRVSVAGTRPDGNRRRHVVRVLSRNGGRRVDTRNGDAVDGHRFGRSHGQSDDVAGLGLGRGVAVVGRDGDGSEIRGDGIDRDDGTVGARRCRGH